MAVGLALRDFALPGARLHFQAHPLADFERIVLQRLKRQQSGALGEQRCHRVHEPITQNPTFPRI
jgi:hypothetical protein